MEYSSETLRRFAAANGARQARSDGGAVVSAEAEDRTLNVWVRFEVELSAGVVRDARFWAYGCPHTMAAASWAAEWLEGKPVDAMRELDVDGMRRALEVPTEKLGKLLRIQDAVAACGERAAALATDGKG